MTADIKTHMLTLHTDGTFETRTFMWPPEPDYATLKTAINLALPGVGSGFERVRIFGSGTELDMFVDEMGAMPGRGLELNPWASGRLYPGPIFGDAVIFNRKVWF